MNKSLGNFGVFLAATLALSACNKESKVAEDVLAQDSTLELSVMSANRDSLAPGGDDSLASAIKSGAISGPKAAAAETPVSTAPVSSSPKAAIRVAPAQSTSVASATPTRSRRKARSIVSTASTRRVARHRTVYADAAPAQSRTTRVRRSNSGLSTPEQTTANSATSATASTVPPHTSTSKSEMRAKASALIPAGSDIEFTSDDRVCSSTSSVGDTFTTRVAEDVIGPFGVVIPKGAIATAEVLNKQNISRTNPDADVGVRIQSVTIAGHTYPIESLVTSSDVTKVQRSHANAGKVLAGAGIGAVLGRVLGHDTRSTVIGAVGGAAAGAVVANRTMKSESCIPDGGHITAKLTEPLRVALTE